MENMVTNRNFWLGKRVFLTGHTGFKGSWLALWLIDMGAKVFGYALEPPSEPNFFNICKVSENLTGHTFADVRNEDMLIIAMQEACPEIIFHLAAQPLVRYSYKNPIETYSTNVMGTVNLFEAARQIKGIKAIINVTTDKCYENQEWLWPYRENEALGGYDPYSSSKACSELVTSAYRSSFFASSNVHVASARAGNVIGGGDWAADRLIPDFLRSLHSNEILTIRSPGATRPWQHVLEPLSGYLRLAEALYNRGESFANAWNFGPNDDDICTVEWILNQLCSLRDGASWQIDINPQIHEATSLRLDSSKAKAQLGWYPRWNLRKALEKVIEWDTAWQNNFDMAKFSLDQISNYESSDKTPL